MSLAFVSLVFGTLLRSTILAALCGALLWVFRVRRAELKHLTWRIVLLALFALPALQIVTPPLRHASQVAFHVESAMFLTPLLGSNSRTPPILRAPELPTRSAQVETNLWISAAAAVCLFVSCIFLFWLAIGLFRLKRIVDRSEFIADRRLHALAHDAWLENGAGLKPRVRISREISVPVAVDLNDTLILLPYSWREWDEKKLRAVLMHEMAHVARCDPSSALLASLAVCVFWIHPLAWFLQRRLASLSEEACDEPVLRTVATPEQYARILMDFASDMARQNGRALVPASAAVHGSQIRTRLEHMCTNSGCVHKTPRAVRVLLLAILFPAIYVVAAARFDGMQTPNEPAPRIVQERFTPEQAGELEARLQKNPDDLNIREKLLNYYEQGQSDAKFVEQLVWVIEHYPDSRATYMSWVVFQSGEEMSTPENREAVKAAWQQAAQQHTDSANALWGLGTSVEKDDPERALNLFQKARQLAKTEGWDRYRHDIARIYTAAVITDQHLGDPQFRLNDIAMNLNTATKLRSKLENSNDPALLTYVGTALVSLSESPGNDAQSALGIEYLQRAVTLDPGNPQWTSALEAAKAEPARRRAYAALANSEKSGTVHIGAPVASANLVKHVDPQYPALALQARIQGTVEFNVVIGTDGHVTSMRLVRGHPLLVNAAQKAVLQWVYQPTLLNGKLVAVTTEVMVPFQLPQ